MDNKTVIFNDFIEKAKRRIEERKKFNTRKYHVESMDVDLTLHGLSEQELAECSTMFESSIECDKYSIYSASPELQDAAKVMVEDGILKDTERYKITDMFTYPERKYLAEQLLELSGVNGNAGIKPVNEVDEVKN